MLSVVIATLNSERPLVPTLASLVTGAATGGLRDVIVVDGGSTDDTAEVADIAGCEFLVEKAPLAQRLRTAAARARAPWLMFLRPGVVINPTWVDECARFQQRTELQGATGKRTAVYSPRPSRFCMQRSAEGPALNRACSSPSHFMTSSVAIATSRTLNATSSAGSAGGTS